jgi:hypothetical protein
MTEDALQEQLQAVDEYVRSGLDMSHKCRDPKLNPSVSTSTSSTQSTSTVSRYR